MSTTQYMVTNSYGSEAIGGRSANVRAFILKADAEAFCDYLIAVVADYERLCVKIGHKDAQIEHAPTINAQARIDLNWPDFDVSVWSECSFDVESYEVY